MHAIIFELYIKICISNITSMSVVNRFRKNCLNCIEAFCCTSVIAGTCMYTCRFVSSIVKALALMHIQMLIHTPCKQDGCFPLFSASQEGHNRIVEILLQAGATVDLQDKVESCCYLFICHLCSACTVFIIH